MYGWYWRERVSALRDWWAVYGVVGLPGGRRRRRREGGLDAEIAREVTLLVSTGRLAAGKKAEVIAGARPHVSRAYRVAGMEIPPGYCAELIMDVALFHPSWLPKKDRWMARRRHRDIRQAREKRDAEAREKQRGLVELQSDLEAKEAELEQDSKYQAELTIRMVHEESARRRGEYGYWPRRWNGL